MSLVAISALRSRLDAYPALAAFFQANYGKAVKHWLGYKRFANANDYPVLCYVPVKTKRTYSNNDQFTISIVLGLCNTDNTGDVLDGVALSSQAEDIIIAALANAVIAQGLKVERDGIDVIYDLGSRHPFYETEFSIKVSQFDVLATGTRPLEIWLGLSPEIGTPFVDKYEQVAP